MITLEAAKAYLRVCHNEEDATIMQLINAALSYVKSYLGRDYPCFRPLTKTIDDPTKCPIICPLADESARVASVEGYDAEGETWSLIPATTADDSAGWWQVDGCLTINVGGFDKIKIAYAIGEDMPDDVCLAVHLLVAHYYENRTAVLISGANAIEMPLGVRSILDVHRCPGTFFA